METVFFLGGSIVFVGLVLWLGIRQRQKLNEVFSDFGMKLGCPVTLAESRWFGFPSIAGTYRRYPLRIWMFTRSSGSGKNRSTTTYTAFSIQVPTTTDFEFHIYEQGFFSKIGIHLFGMQDIQIQDDEFDREFVIKGKDENRIIEFLTPDIKQKFLEFARKYVAFGVKYSGGQLYYERAATLRSEKFRMELEELINFYCDLADRIATMERHRS